jgi:protein-S-isoprenylcysteine O-methyltransferase Ste14
MTHSEAILPADNAGVRFPPPLIYLAFFAVGMYVQRIAPRPLVPAGEGRAVAVMLAAAWAVLHTWTVLCFHRVHTSVIPVRPTMALVVKGPFRLTRNPLYVGMVLLYAAASLWLNALWPLVLLLPLIVIIQTYAIAREERYLERKFGTAYVEYRRRVRRWI